MRMGKKGARSKPEKGSGQPSVQRKSAGRGDKAIQASNKDKSSWLDALGAELAAVGLRVKQIAADGNCFFRAVADQLGNSSSHLDLRVKVVSFMRQHQDEFEPFMEDDEPFDKYCTRMAKDGTWAGQQEQVALARCLGMVLCIYQAGQPCWNIRPDSPDFPKEAPMLHLSYHGEEHYNSVRLQEDYGNGSPMPIVFRDAPAIKALAPDRSDEAHKLVKRATGSDDDALVAAALQQAGGNIDEAIETVISNLAQEMESAVGVSQEPEAQSEAAQTGAEPERRPVNGAAAADGHQTGCQQAVHCSDQEEDARTQDVTGSISQDVQGEGAAAGPDGRPAMLQASCHSDPQPAQGGVNESESALESGMSRGQGIAADTASPLQPAMRPSGPRELDRQPDKESSPAVEPIVPPLKASTPLKGENTKNKAARQKREKPVGRNHPCPCGSHKKFKACCGRQSAKAPQLDSKAQPDEGIVSKERPHMATLFV